MYNDVRDEIVRELLAIDERAKIHKTSLGLPKDLSHENWLAIGHVLKPYVPSFTKDDEMDEIDSSIMWWLGDWFCFGEDRVKKNVNIQ
jgi:hypothetical protein